MSKCRTRNAQHQCLLRARKPPFTLQTYTLHPTTYTLHPTPYITPPAPHTLHPTPHTLRPTPYTLHSETQTENSRPKPKPQTPKFKAPNSKPRTQTNRWCPLRSRSRLGSAASGELRPSPSAAQGGRCHPKPQNSKPYSPYSTP